MSKRDSKSAYGFRINLEKANALIRQRNIEEPELNLKPLSYKQVRDWASKVKNAVLVTPDFDFEIN